MEVSLLKRLEVARERLWGSGEASGASGGEAGGPLGPPTVRRSRTCPPWKVLRTVVPRARRARSEEAVVAMLWLEGDAGGTRPVTELRWKAGGVKGGEETGWDPPGGRPCHPDLFSLPFGSSAWRSVPGRSVQT